MTLKYLQQYLENAQKKKKKLTTPRKTQINVQVCPNQIQSAVVIGFHPWTQVFRGNEEEMLFCVWKLHFYLKVGHAHIAHCSLNMDDILLKCCWVYFCKGGWVLQSNTFSSDPLIILVYPLSNAFGLAVTERQDYTSIVSLPQNRNVVKNKEEWMSKSCN